MTAAKVATLSEFLLARIAEDEAAARAMDDLGWSPSAHDPSFGARVSDDVISAYWSGPGDPARVLAECDAKRRIVEGYSDLIDSGRGEQEQSLWWACALLAVPYASHPDYRDEWRP